MRPLLAALVLLIVALGAPLPARAHAPRADARAAAVSRTGTLGDAQYRIEAPAEWRGGLVVFAHGIQRGPGPGAVAAPPLASHILGEGHAWAASGYRAREYRPDWFIEDLVALRELFLNEIGRPRWTIIYGQSMGGHIVVASLELRPGLYQGGLAECGLVDGIGIADYLFRVHRRRRADLRCAPPRCAGQAGILEAPQRAIGAGARHAGRVHGTRPSVQQRREISDGRRSAGQRSAVAPSGPPAPVPPEHDPPPARRGAG